MPSINIAVNCLNIPDPDAPVYRVFPPLGFLDVLVKKKLTLVQPRAWDDPYENILFKRTFRLPDGTPVSVESLRNALWGQCWSLTVENDAMWRIYSPQKDGVKVRSTPRKLLQAIWKDSFDVGRIKYFIGKVDYLSEQEIVQWFADPNNVNLLMFDNTGRGPVLALLLKRIEFYHEDEVRLVCHDRQLATQSVAQFDIDPNQLFDEVVLDSRMPPYLADTFTSTLQTLGFKNPILRSTLYNQPPAPTVTTP